MSQKRSWKLDALLLLAVQCAVFLPVIVQGGTLLPVADSAVPPWTGEPASSGQDFAGTDRAVFSWPNWHRIHNAGVTRWEDYLHNQQILCGSPFLGTLDTAVFSLTTILLWIFPLGTAVLASAVLHGWIAGLCARLTLRLWVKDERAAVLGAALFSCTPWLIAHQDVFPFVESAAWTPLIFHGAWQLARHGRAHGFLTLAFGFAASFFGGLPQLTLVCTVAAGFLAALGCAATWRTTSLAHAWQRAALCMGAVVAGLILTLPVLLPGYAMSRTSARAEIPSAELKASAMQPAELTGLLVPDLLGAPARLYEAARPGPEAMPAHVTEHNFPLARWAEIPSHGASHLERLCGVSAVGTLLCCLALFALRERRVQVALLVALAGLLLAMATPLLDLLLALPGFSFGSARRWVFWAVLGLSALAAFGLDAALQDQRKKRIALAATIALSFPVLLLGIARFAPEALRGFVDDPSSSNDAALLMPIPRWVESVTWPVAVCMALAALALLRTRWIIWTLPLLIALEGMFLQAQLNPHQQDTEPFQETATLTKLRELTTSDGPVPGLPWRIARFRSPDTDVPEARGLPMALPSNLGMLHGLYDIHGYEGMLHKDYESLLACAEPGVAVAHHLIREFHDPAALSHGVLDLLGAKWVVSSGQLPLPLVAAYPAELCAIYENPSAQPIVQLPRTLSVLSDGNAVQAALRSREFRPEQVAYVEATDASALGAAALAQVPEGPLPVLRAEFASTRVAVHFEGNPSPRPILLAISYDPHWRAFDQDGRPLPLVRADQALMLSILPAGHGIVRFEYGHADVSLGIMLSILALLGTLITWKLLARRAENSPC